MDKRIIYQTDDGGVAIVVPSDCQFTIQEIAAKDVPKGKPYKIIDISDIPTDRTFRNAWEVNIVDPDGYGIGQDEWHEQQNSKKEVIK